MLTHEWERAYGVQAEIDPAFCNHLTLFEPHFERLSLDVQMERIEHFPFGESVRRSFNDVDLI